MQWKKENVLILLSLLVLAFFLINMFSGGGRGRQQSRELIYSDFKNLVAAGEISNAQFVGDTRIEGFTLDGTPYRTYIPENDTKLVDFRRHFQVQINYTPEQGPLFRGVIDLNLEVSTEVHQFGVILRNVGPVWGSIQGKSLDAGIPNKLGI